MPPPDGRNRVRPISLLDEVGSPDASQPQLTDPDLAKRRRGGVMMVVLVAIMATSALIAWGSVADDPSADESLENTNPNAAHLGAEDQLLIVAEAIDGKWEVTWDRLQPPPTTTGLIGLIPAPGSSEADSRSLDAGGTVLGDHGCRDGICSIGLFALAAPLERIATIEGKGFTWHEDDALRIAWVDGAGADATIRSGILDEDTGVIERTATHGVIGAEDQLVRWDEHGFIVTGTQTRAIDSDGAELWATGASVLDMSPGLITVEPEPGAWSIIDRVGGRTVMEASPEAPTISVADVPEDERTTTVTTRGYRYTITTPNTDKPLRSASVGSNPGNVYRIYRDAEGTRVTIGVERAGTDEDRLSFG